MLTVCHCCQLFMLPVRHLFLLLRPICSRKKDVAVNSFLSFPFWMIRELRVENTKAKISNGAANRSLNPFEDPIIRLCTYSHFKITSYTIGNFGNKGDLGKAITVKTEILAFFSVKTSNTKVNLCARFDTKQVHSKCSRSSPISAELGGTYGPPPERLTTLQNVLSLQRDYIVIAEYAYRPSWQNKHTPWWYVTLPSVRGL